VILCELSRANFHLLFAAGNHSRQPLATQSPFIDEVTLMRSWNKTGCWLTWTLMLAASLTCCCAPVLAATAGEQVAGLQSPSQSPAAADVADLKQQLEKGLKARRPQEFAFVALVVDMVDEDKLPLSLVKSTFLWARKKAASTRYPFPYFERALRVRAAKQGYDIP